MTQSELLKLAIEKAGSKQKLADLIDVDTARVHEWNKGTAMRFDTMVKILKAVNIEIITSKLA